MEKTDKRWKRRTNDRKDRQTMEKTDKQWKRRTNDGERRTNDRKDGQTMEKGLTYLLSLALSMTQTEI